MVALERAGILVERYVAYEIEPNAIMISKKNYPQIEHCGDVRVVDFTQYAGFDLLIGGSPCTFWSKAKCSKTAKQKREIDADGTGWQLFEKFAEAKENAKPKYFLYENNYEGYFVHHDCKMTIVPIETSNFTTEKLAIQAWNERSEEDE